jgi:hypothetical protein
MPSQGELLSSSLTCTQTQFPQLLKETQHFGGPQQQVAKIVHCGEHYSLTIEEEATREGGLNFL